MPSPQPIAIAVPCAPPAKDGAISIRNPEHPDHAKVQAIRDAMGHVMAQQHPFGRIPLKMTMHCCRGTCRADALNMINGVADIIQKRCNTPSYRWDVWATEDDEDIREFHNTEEPAETDSYTVTIGPLEATGSGS